MPFIKMFGLSVFSIRLAPAILGCFAVWIIFLLGRRIESTNFGLVVAAITAISPWHIMISRWALESNILPVFMLTSVYLLVKASDNKRFLPLSFFFFGVSLYAYAPSYLVIPLFLLCAGIYCIYFRVFTTKNITISGLVLGLTALPIFAFVLINTLKLPAFESSILSIPRYTGAPRYTHMSSIFGGSFFQETAQFLGQSIKILFIDFNDFETQNSAPNVGYIAKFSLPLILGGFLLCCWKVITGKKFTPLAFILFWFFCSFLVSGTSSPAIHRMNTVVFPIIIFCAYGLYELFNRSKAIAISFCILFGISSYNFYHVYTGEYARNISSFFFEGYAEAVGDAYQHLAPGEKLYASDALNQPYIATLFQLKYDPYKYLETVKFQNPNDAFQSVLEYGDIVFGVRTGDAQKAKVLVIRRGEDELYYNLRNYIVREYHEYLALYSREEFHEDSNGNIVREPNLMTVSSLGWRGDVYSFSAEWQPSIQVLVEVSEFYGSRRKMINVGLESNQINILRADLFLGSNKVRFLASSSDGRQKIEEFIVASYGENVVNGFDFIKTSTQDIGASQINKAFTNDNLIVQGLQFSSGIGTHASSEQVIELPQNAEKLSISYGLSDFSGGCGDGVKVIVESNNRVLVTNLVAHHTVYSNTLYVRGISKLRLISEFGENRYCDHLNWLSADLTLTP